MWRNLAVIKSRRVGLPVFTTKSIRQPLESARPAMGPAGALYGALDHPPESECEMQPIFQNQVRPAS
jgi:hypothetical protein